jgi:hypothetical protein
MLTTSEKKFFTIKIIDKKLNHAPTADFKDTNLGMYNNIPKL